MKRTYTKGIIGAILGGLIASLPWVLVYVYGEEIYAILALIISIGSLIGYQLFKGKVDKKLPFIIAAISLFCVSFATLIIIPLLLLTRYGGSLSLINIKILYNDPTFVDALMKDYAISILFTIIGMSATIKHISATVKSNPNKQDLEIPLGSGSKKDKESVKQYFITKEALSEETAVEIEESSNIKEHSLAALIDDGIIIKKGDKYYYSKKNDETVTAAKKKSNKLVIIILSIILGIPLLLLLFGSSEPTEGDYDYRVAKDITFELSNDYLEQVDEEDINSWYYIPKKDISGGTGYIYISYTKDTITFDKENLDTLKSSFYGMTGVTKVTQGKVFTTSNNYSAIEFKVEFKDYTDYIYYIIRDDYTAIIELVDYNKIDGLLEDTKLVVDTFNWTK